MLPIKQSVTVHMAAVTTPRTKDPNGLAVLNCSLLSLRSSHCVGPRMLESLLLIVLARYIVRTCTRIRRFSGYAALRATGAHS